MSPLLFLFDYNISCIDNNISITVLSVFVQAQLHVSAPRGDRGRKYVQQQ